MRMKVRRSVCAIFLLTLLTVTPAFAKKTPSKKPDAKQLYDTAVRLENDLKKAKVPPAVAAWKKVVSAYRNVYYQYPSSGYCDNSLFQIASLYSDMAEQFKDSFYSRRALATYQFLIEQYPSSPL